MSHTVVVTFNKDREYSIPLHEGEVASMTKEQAREWLHDEFDMLECEPANPMGKLLLLDMILNVARYGGESHFQEQDSWSKEYAIAVSAALKRPVVHVDLVSSSVG